MPAGPEMLSAWFEWLTVEGSRDSSLKRTVEENSKSVFGMIETYLSQMKGEAWNLKLEEVTNNTQATFGNDVMIKVFLLRDLAKTWKNEPEKLIYIEGVDDLNKVSKQPFIHVLRVNQLGEADFEERLNISVRIGNTMVFNDISLHVALSSIIELSFVFNLMFPPGCDDMFQFTQRILANFGPSDGARNLQGKVKKNFLDFQIAMGKMIIDGRKGEVIKLFM